MVALRTAVRLHARHYAGCVFLVVRNIWHLKPVRPAAAFELRLDHTVLRAHCLYYFTVAYVHADVPVVPDRKSRRVGYGIYRAGDRGVIVHLVCADIRHTVCTVAQLQRLRIEPTVTFDESNAVDFRSAPYFDLIIDGVTNLNTNFGG